MPPLQSHLADAVSLIQDRIPALPKLAIVLGSGFGNLADRLTDAHSIPYSDLPGWPIGKVPGHAGKLAVGRLGSVPVILLCGRAHYYEGFSLEEVTFPIRVLAELGVETLLLTNAAGGIADRMRPGDFMVIQDHINFMGENPLRGTWGVPPKGFVDMTTAYDITLQEQLLDAGKEAQIPLHRGVYLSVSGPSFETPAEIRAFRILGASAVGMSSVPETIVARQCGLRVAGLSCITNVAAGLGGKDQKVNHEEVLDVGQQVADSAEKLVEGFVRRWSDST
ncbi:MAG TPA: purine-nucleoside phosphorylase [Candidatus Limnocylindria bacterium]|jgi:purine-nucleoside phosphorylase|nr:purine-nucleoside phosphorylase [Candidatus Limnocylindria bacterium]